MTRCVLILLCLGVVDVSAPAQEARFEKTRYTAATMKSEPEVVLTVTGAEIEIEGKKLKEFGRLTIPFGQIDSMTYDSAQRHRIAEGASQMGLAPVFGAVLMTTKTTSYWLDIHYHDADTQHTAVLQLDKTEYQKILETLRARTGKEISEASGETADLNPTAGSVNMDEVVSYQLPAVTAAIKPAMMGVGCNITVERVDRIECKRPRGGSEITGAGGEKVVATFEPRGDQTRIRIETDRGFNGHMAKKNWSTPIYKEMMDKLKQSEKLDSR